MALPKPKKQNNGLLPTPETGGDFDPFLTVAEIGNGKLGAKATLNFTGEAVLDQDNQFGPRLQCSVTLKKKDYIFGVKLDGGSYGRLFRRFGNNPKKWRGPVKVEVKKHMGKLYIATV